MTLLRVQHNKNYTTINNTICTDKRLSWKAKGIWLYAFSRPDTWKFYLSDLINQSTDGKDSVRAGLKELNEAGYLRKTRFRNEDGKFNSEVEWIFFETPFTDTSEPKADFPILDNPTLDNPPLVSTDSVTSTKEQQTAVAAFFDCLKEVNIPEYEKVWLSKNYSEDEVIHGVAYSLHPTTKISTTLIQMVKWACKTQPTITIPHEDKQKQQQTEKDKAEDQTLVNKAEAHEIFRHLWTSVPVDKTQEGWFYPCLERLDHLELNNGRETEKVYFIDKKFKEKILHFLRKSGYPMPQI